MSTPTVISESVPSSRSTVTTSWPPTLSTLSRTNCTTATVLSTAVRVRVSAVCEAAATARLQPVTSPPGTQVVDSGPATVIVRPPAGKRTGCSKKTSRVPVSLPPGTRPSTDLLDSM